MEKLLEGLACHYTWKLEADSNKEFDVVYNQLSGHLEECKNLAPDRPQKNEMYMSGKCLQSYMYGAVSPFNKNFNSSKALDCIQESSDQLEQMDNLLPDAKKAYKYILLANKAWTYYKSSRKSLVNTILDEIDDIDLTPKIKAYINGCKGFAMSRFGPNKYDEGVRCFRHAVNFLPENGLYWSLLAILLTRQRLQLKYNVEKSKKYNEEIIEAFENSIKRDEKDGITLALYARFLCDIKKYKQADELFKKAEEADPNSSRVLKFIGEYYYKKFRDYMKSSRGTQEININADKAIEYFRRARKYENSTFTIHKLGKVFEDIGDLEEARKHYIEALDVSSTNFPAKIDLAKLLFYKLNKQDEGYQLLSQLIHDSKNDKDKSGAHLQMGEFLIKEGENEDGYQQFRESIDLYPEGFFQLKATRQYIGYFREKLDKDGNGIDVLCNLGWGHSKLNEVDVSCGYYTRAYDHENSSAKQKADIVSKILEIYLKSKRIKEAGDWVKKTERRDLQIRYYKEAAVVSTSKQDHFQACIDLSEAVKLGSLEAAETLMKTLIEHNDNLREKDWWGFYRFCGCISVLCDTDSKHIFENDEDVQQSACGTLSQLQGPEYSIEERKNIIRPENYISKLFPHFEELLISFHKKCIDLAKENLLVKQEDELVNASYNLKNAIITVFAESRSVLDKIMAKFQEAKYPHLDKPPKFMFITGNEVEKDLRIELEKRQKWKQFSIEFRDLFEYLVLIQPGENINWLILLITIRNIAQHQKGVHEMNLPLHKINVKIAKDKYIENHPVEPIKLAVKSAEEVEKIVNKFYIYL